MGHRFRFIIAAIALTGLAGLLATAPVRTALAAATVLPDSPNAAKGGTIGPDAVTPAPAPDPDAADTPDEALPVVEYDFDKLPAPVKRLREQIIEAASTGDPNKLRPIIDANPDLQLSYNEIGDPIDYIKSLSGDEGGREILAILIEVLQAGYVHAARRHAGRGLSLALFRPLPGRQADAAPDSSNCSSWSMPATTRT